MWVVILKRVVLGRLHQTVSFKQRLKKDVREWALWLCGEEEGQEWRSQDRGSRVSEELWRSWCGWTTIHREISWVTRGQIGFADYFNWWGRRETKEDGSLEESLSVGMEWSPMSNDVDRSSKMTTDKTSTGFNNTDVTLIAAILVE